MILLLILIILFISFVLVPQMQTGQRKLDYDISKVDNMTGVEFEAFCKSLLMQLGFNCISETPVTGDFGIDLVASLDGEKYGIQCKRYKENVGVKAISETVGGLKHWNCQRGMVITNSRFTKNATVLAQDNQVMLCDREWLIAQIQKVNRANRKKPKNVSVEKLKNISVEKPQTIPALAYSQISNWNDLMAGKITAIIPPGRYMIGTDIPCGKYNIIAHSGNGHISLLGTDYNMKVNASIRHTHEAFYVREFKNLDCYEGDLLIVEQAEVKLMLANPVNA